MASGVNGGSRRARQAAETRRRVVEAAGTLFVQRGYAAATIEAIAAAADVSVETVYARFRNKRNLLAAYLDLSIAGDADPAPILDREPVRQIAGQTDQRRQVRMMTRLSRSILERSAPAHRVLRSAAESDRTVEKLLQVDDQNRRQVQRAFMELLRKNGRLRKGLTLEDATDAYGALANPDTYAFVTRRRGWTPDRFEQWLRETAERMLLPS
ncbi:MAG: TetR family transcriptional regulator [Actinomycetota bacterium]